MTAPLSELDKMRASNLARAAERMALTLQAQGVEKVRAMEFVEAHVTFLQSPGATWLAVAGARRARGTSDECLVWLARELHLDHPELGGVPVPFGHDRGPEYQGVAELAEQRAIGRRQAEAARQRVLAREAVFAEQRRAAAVAAHLAGDVRVDPARRF